MTSILEDITGTIQQAVDLLRDLPAGLYERVDPPAYESPIGAHLRHNIDHYHSFMDGRGTGKVDYDHRSRDRGLETDRDLSITALERVMANLSTMGADHLDAALLVRMDCGGDAGWSRSTARRELQFLLSHTVHHYAIIGMICRLNGYEPRHDFGIAPSTLKFRATQQTSISCAR